MSYEKPNIKSKHFNNLFNKLPSMEGKTVAITGTTSGTGFVAAQACGKLGARVLLLNRPSTRADAALNDLQSQNSNADFTQIDCDLQSLVRLERRQKLARFAQKDWMCFATMLAYGT